MTASRLRSLVSSRTASLRAHRRQVVVLLGAIGGFTVIAATGDVLSGVLLPQHAVVLLVLTPRTAYLVAAAHDVPLVLYVIVAVARLGAADPLHFMLGRRLGYSPISRARLLWLSAVAVSPTGKTMVLAGMAGLPRWPVAMANVVGTSVRVLVTWRIGAAFPTLGATVGSLAPWFAIPGCVAAVTVVLKVSSALRVAREPA
jgi:hypothetical protein